MILEMNQACIRMHWLAVVQLLSHLPCYNNDIHFTIIRAFWGISLLSNPINPAGMETLASRVGRFESELEALRREAMVGLEGGKSWNPGMMLFHFRSACKCKIYKEGLDIQLNRVFVH